MKIPALAAAILIAAASQVAQAATVRVDFSGTVSLMDCGWEVPDPVAAIGGSIALGTAFSGHFILDDSVAPFSVSAEESRYGFAPGGGEFVTEVGAFALDASWVDPANPEFGTFMSILHPTTGGVLIGADLGPYPTGAQFEPFNIGLLLALPAYPPSLALVPWSSAQPSNSYAGWAFLNGEGSVVYVEGTLDSLSVTVPEPGPGALGAAALLAGLVALGFRRARG